MDNRLFPSLLFREEHKTLDFYIILFQRLKNFSNSPINEVKFVNPTCIKNSSRKCKKIVKRLNFCLKREFWFSDSLLSNPGQNPFQLWESFSDRLETF